MAVNPLTGLQTLDPSVNTGLQGLLDYENQKLAALKSTLSSASNLALKVPTMAGDNASSNIISGLGTLAGPTAGAVTSVADTYQSVLNAFSFGRIISIVLGLLLIGGGLILFAGEDIGETIAKAPELITGV